MAYRIGTHVWISRGREAEAHGTVVGYTTLEETESGYISHFYILELDDEFIAPLGDTNIFVTHLCEQESALRRTAR